MWKELLNKLESCAPSIDALLGIGMTNEEARSFVSSFVATKRQCVISTSIDLGWYGELVKNYDISDIVIGLVRFFDVPKCQQGRCYIGNVEADWLVIDTTTGHVLVLEAGAEQNVLWVCSEDAIHFFTALVYAACYFSRCAIDEDFYEDNEEREKIINQCIRLAGGTEYKSFYEMLLG